MIAACIVFLSFVTFVCFGVDKWKAKNQRWRIKEATLMGLCVLGGSVGGLLGMYVFHHKTRKPLFFVGIPLILTVQILCFIYLYLR